MRRRTKRTIWFPSYSFNYINEWAEFLLPIYRTAIPMIMLNVLASRVQAIYLQAVNITISATGMYWLILISHALAALSSFRMKYNHGCLYETSRAFLASEFILFFYSLQYDLTLGITLLSILVCGLLLLLTSGRIHLTHCYQHNYLPHALSLGVIFSDQKTLSSSALLYVALRRYLVIATSMLLAFPSIASLSVFWTDEALPRNNTSAIIRTTSDNPLQQNAQAIHLLSEDQWHYLNNQDKIRVLQVVADIEARRMQIEPVLVINCHLENNTIGAYNHIKREAQIDLEKHEGYSSFEYINTILHECRHAYQHDCIDSLNWNDPSIQNGIYYAQVRQWKYEHMYYISSSEDHDAYYCQAIEKDARYYAEEGLHLYQQYLYSEP